MMFGQAGMGGMGGMGVYSQGFSGTPQQYGSAEDVSQDRVTASLLGRNKVMKPVVHGPGARRRLNNTSIILAFVIPSGIFFATFYLMSFNVHYMQPTLTYLLCAALLFPALGFGAAAANATRKKKEGQSVEPSWYLFLFSTCLLAWASGLILGETNYAEYMNAYFDRSNLRRVKNVTPGETHGQTIMDGGEIYFSEGARVNTKLSYGYKNTDRYCVAPVTMGDDKLASYDFWAVGINCCYGMGNFGCGNMFDPKVRAGLRWWGDAEQQNFAMAVGQAVAAYGIQAQHPIFISWMEDPTGKRNQNLRNAWTFAIYSILGYAVVQAILVAMATTWYGKLKTYQGPTHGHGHEHA